MMDRGHGKRGEKMRSSVGAAIVVAIAMVCTGVTGKAQTGGSHSELKEAIVNQHVTGHFDVKVLPQPAEDAGGAGIGRMLLDKQFHGALEATSKGQMLAFGTGA